MPAAKSRLKPIYFSSWVYFIEGEQMIIFAEAGLKVSHLRVLGRAGQVFSGKNNYEKMQLNNKVEFITWRFSGTLTLKLNVYFIYRSN